MSSGHQLGASSKQHETTCRRQYRKRSHLGPKHRVFHHQRKQEKSVGIRGMTSSTPFLALMMICSKRFLKSASGTNKFISILIQMSMNSKLHGFLRIKELFQRL